MVRIARKTRNRNYRNFVSFFVCRGIFSYYPRLRGNRRILSRPMEALFDRETIPHIQELLKIRAPRVNLRTAKEPEPTTYIRGIKASG